MHLAGHPHTGLGKLELCRAEHPAAPHLFSDCHRCPAISFTMSLMNFEPGWGLSPRVFCPLSTPTCGGCWSFRDLPPGPRARFPPPLCVASLPHLHFGRYPPTRAPQRALYTDLGLVPPQRRRRNQAAPGLVQSLLPSIASSAYCTSHISHIFT